MYRPSTTLAVGKGLELNKYIETFGLRPALLMQISVKAMSRSIYRVQIRVRVRYTLKCCVTAAELLSC